FSVLGLHASKLSSSPTRLTIRGGTVGMNTKVLLGCLGGLLAATGVFYVQSHRKAKVAVERVAAVAPEPPPTPAPVVAPEPPPVPEPVKPTPPKRVVSKTVASTPEPAPAPAPIERALVEQAKV